METAADIVGLLEKGRHYSCLPSQMQRLLRSGANSQSWRHLELINTKFGPILN